MTLSADTRAEARRLLALAWPVVLTSLNWTLMHLIDVAVVGRAGVEELGALAASRALTYVLITFALAGLSGVLVFASRADGAGRVADAGTAFRGGLLLAGALGLVTAGLLEVGAATALRVSGVAPALVGPGAAVSAAIGWAFPGSIVAIAASYTLEGLSRPRRVLVVNLVTLPLNAALCVPLVHGWGPVPALGAVGAGVATAIAAGVGGVLMVAAALTCDRAGEARLRRVDRRAWGEAARAVPALIAFGWVPAVGAALELVGFSTLIVLSTRFGVDAAVAFQAVFSLHNFVFGLAMGFGSAAGVRVGNAVGADRWEAVGRRVAIAAGLTVAAVALPVAMFLLVPHALVTPLVPAGPARALAVAMLLGLAPFMVFDGLQWVFVSALRSMGDQVAAGANGVAGFFAVMSGLAWALTAWGAGPMGLIWAAAAGVVVVAALDGARLRVVLRLRTGGPVRGPVC